MRQRYVHAEARHQRDETLWYGHRLHIAGSVGPGDGDFQVTQVLAELLTDCHQVSQRLAGVINVALHVNDRNLRPLGDVTHIGLAFARDQVMANGNAMPIAGQNGPHVLRALAMRDLRRLRIDEMGVAAQLGHACLE